MTWPDAFLGVGISVSLAVVTWAWLKYAIRGW
jgi:hypothetical protein